MNISFIVCCHNSAPRLPTTVAHLAAIEPVPGVEWEVIVVDNASTDDTAAVAQRSWSRAGAPVALRVVREPIPGLVHSRHRGVYAARHEIVCFVDDDNWIGPDWLRILNSIFTCQPAVGAVGGLGRPVFDGPEPGWFRSVEWAYAVGPQGLRSGEVSRVRGYLFGAGIALRRHALLDIEKKGFRPLLTGRKGAEVLAGEDSELCFALTLAGWRLWYDERLVFQHFIPCRRLTLSYAKLLIEQLGYASAYLDEYVFAGAAARPRRWVFLNKHFLTRAFGVGLKYGWVALSSYLRSRDTRLPFLKGRLKGIFLGLRTQTALRRNLLGFAERFQRPPVDPSAASHAASANGARKRCAIPHR